MDDELINAARQARERAHAPHSRYRAGAALLTSEGKIFSGCNVESSTYGLTICAERVAIFKAVSEGFRKFSKLCLVSDSPELVPPCGACRQIIWELCGDLPILIVNDRDDRRVVGCKELLPDPFDAETLFRATREPRPSGSGHPE